jgi:hypothetical protein
MWRQQRKEKRKPPTSEKCYIPSMGLSIIESEVDSPCFSKLLNPKSIHLASEFCQKYRIEVRYQKDFGYLEKMVGINLDLFQSTAIHSDTNLFSPLSCESLLQLISELLLLHNIICLLFEHSTPTHPNPETQQHNIQSVLSTYETSGFQ